MKTYWTSALFICLVMFGLVENNYCLQPQTADITQLQQILENELGKDFEFFKGDLKQHPVESEKNQYWLAHVKPQRTGFFTIKYAYQFADKFYASGETEMKIAVGGKDCSRYPQVVREIGYFCLGDTIVIPVRISNFSKHTFELQTKYDTAENVESSRKVYNYMLNRLDTEKVVNPIESNIQYLGKFRDENLFRNGGGIFTHYAVFEAKSIGRFRLNISYIYENEAETKSNVAIKATNPIIIINRGDSITSLVPIEKATFFIKDRSYSSANTNSFESNLLILHPGEIFSIQFSTFRAQAWWEEKNGISESKAKKMNPKPIIQKEPFLLKKNEGYNEWLKDFVGN